MFMNIMVSPSFHCRTWIVLLSGILVLISARRSTAAAYTCRGNAIAYAAVQSSPNFTVQSLPDLAYGFYYVNPALSPLVGGPNVSRGLIIVPANGVAPVSYAPYARTVALRGYYVAILKKSTLQNVLEVMIQHSELEYWAIAGHGTGASLAARVAVAVQPRVKALILISAPLPPELDLRSTNVFVTVLYGAADTINIPADVEASFSRLRGDTLTTKVPGLGYYDFAYSTCVGNSPVPAGGSGTSLALTPAITLAILTEFIISVYGLQWAAASPRGLSFGDNHFLTPGFNDSKPYPGDIRVRFDQVEVPGSNPKRHWWVFTPTAIKGGIVYFAGGGVEGKAYFPIAFEIAARGQLVVVIESPARFAQQSLTDPNAIIDSNLPIFSGVPKGRWAIAGHSLGGGAATLYAGCFGDKIYGAVLHSGEFNNNINTSEVPILQLFGSLDNTMNGAANFKNNYLGRFNPSTTTFQVVEGANHYQVGDYGYQVPDQIATISIESQQDIYANITVTYLDSLPNRSYPPTLFGQTCTNGFVSFGL